jgi:hypothetical protein
MDIHEAIRNSNLGKYQKEIDRCNKKKGCNAFCSKEEQQGCPKLSRHTKEMANLKYDR